MSDGTPDPVSFSSPHVRAVYEYWLRLKRDRRAPDRSEIDPLEIPKSALPYVLLVDLFADPLRIRYRLVGTYCVAIFGMDYTGFFLDQLGIPEMVREQIYEDYARVVSACSPVVSTYRWPLINGSNTIAEYAILPLLDGRTVSRCLCVEHIGYRRAVFPDEIIPIKANG